MSQLSVCAPFGFFVFWLHGDFRVGCLAQFTVINDLYSKSSIFSFLIFMTF